MEIVLKFVFMAMIQTSAQLCDKSNFFMIVTIKTLTWQGCNKSEETIFENTKTFWVLKRRSNFPFSIYRRKERVFEEVVSNFKRGNVISISHSICIGFLRFWFKKLLKIFVFVEVSCIAPVLAKQALYWIDSSFCWKDLSQTQS